MSPQPRPVIEVIAEIGFATSDGEGLPDMAGPHLYGKLRRRYPILERATDVQLQVEVRDDSDAIEARCDGVSYRFLYRTEPRSVTVQLSPTALQLHFSGPYPGWQMVQDIIAREWTTTAQALNLRLGAHLSLRMVAQLPLKPQHQTVGDWLRSNAFMPEFVRQRSRGYQCRADLTEAEADVTTMLAVTPAEALVLDSLDTKPISVDVAVQQDLSHRVVQKPLVARLQALQTRVQAVFDEALTPRAKRYLQLNSRRPAGDVHRS